MVSRVKRRFALPLFAAARIAAVMLFPRRVVSGNALAAVDDIAASQVLLGAEDSRTYQQTRELTLSRGEDGFGEVLDALASLRCRVSLRGLPEGGVRGISASYTVLLSDGTALTICDTGAVQQNGRIYAACPAGRERLLAAIEAALLTESAVPGG